MKPQLYTLIIVSLAIAIVSCKSASKMYEKGRYDEAVAVATKKLSKKPDDGDLIEVVQNSYRYAVEDHERRIRTYNVSTSSLRYEDMYNEYAQLQSLYEMIWRSPSVASIVLPTDYSSFLQTYQEEASNARVQRGDQLMDQNNKQGSRDAYYEFQKALQLKPGDLVIKQKIDEAYNNAVTNVIIQPIARTGYQYSSYQYDFNNFNYEMLRYLNSNNSNNFIRYYSNNDAGSRNIRLDNMIDIRFSDVNIGRYRDLHTTREVTKQVVGREIVHKKDSVTKEYITVKARLTITTRRIQADGLLQATVKDYNDRWLWSDTYRGDYSWEASFASFTGDERALSEEDRQLVSRRESWPPSNDEIIRIIMNDIQNKARCGVSDYFKRYI